MRSPKFILLLLWTAVLLAPPVRAAGPEDNFPPGGVFPSGWATTPGATAGWAVASDQANGGTFSLKSAPMPDDPTAPSNSRRTAGIQVGGSFSGGTISFAYKASSEAGADFLEFWIDGTRMLQVSGAVPWTPATFPVAAGNHVFKWVYDKDASLSDPIDAAWIDTVALPAGTVQQLLSVTRTGSGTGSVFSNVAGITCGAACAGHFATGSSVLLSAASSPGSVFSGWSGACAGASLTCTVSMTVAKNAVATFIPADDLFPAGGAVPADWSNAPGSSIAWKVASDSTNRGPFSMKAGTLSDGQVSAMQFTSTVNSGTVDFAYRTSSEAFYDVLTLSIDGVVRFSAGGDSGWKKASVPVAAGTHVFKFAYGKDVSIGAGNDSVWVDSLVLPPAGAQRLTVTGDGVGAGSVISSPGGIDCGATCTAAFATNSVVTLTATPANGSVLTAWGGACAGSTTTCQVVMGGMTDVSITFWIPGVPGWLDIDASTPGSAYDPMTDGVLLTRYLFGMSGQALTAGAIGSNATRTDPLAIVTYLDGIRASLDVDGNGTVDALTDGLLIIRYLFGLRGAALINNVVGAGAARTTAAQIESYIQALTP